jgi:hypothetical protein
VFRSSKLLLSPPKTQYITNLTSKSYIQLHFVSTLQIYITEDMLCAVGVRWHSPNHCCGGKAKCFKYSVCLYPCLISPVCKSNHFCPIHCHLWPVWLYHIFSTWSHKRHDFRGWGCWGGRRKLLNLRCELIFLTTFVWNICYSKKNSARSYKRGSQDCVDGVVTTVRTGLFGLRI